MSFTEKSLGKNETIIYKSELHWIIFAGPAIILFFGLSFLLGEPKILGVMLLLVGMFATLGTYLNKKSSEFAVTTKRVVLKTGLIRRQSTELMLSKIEVIQVKEGLLGRLFGYGQLVVGGSGGSKEGFKHIVNPEAFRRNVNLAIEESSTPVKQNA